MIIWSLDSETKFHRLVLVWERDSKVTLNFIGKPFGDSWRPLPVEIAYRQDGVMGNFLPGFNPGILNCDERALKIIWPLVVKSAEFLPLECEFGKFFAINVTDVIDCLDHQASEFEHFNSGSIKKILRYEFRPNCVKDKPIFKLPEKRRGPIFVSDKFKLLIENNRLTGLTFRKVWE